jgi:hypothetical protein
MGNYAPVYARPGRGPVYVNNPLPYPSLSPLIR